jgi:hypothetical protein
MTVFRNVPLSMWSQQAGSTWKAEICIHKAENGHVNLHLPSKIVNIVNISSLNFAQKPPFPQIFTSQTQKITLGRNVMPTSGQIYQ